ncbi:MAG: hypothetical protein HOP19_00055 [Acidobacteria bacterium]|nr:hypothetical protein [Acidobacteriota bacterium]
MWKQFLDLLRQIFRLTDDTQANARKIKELQEQIEALTRTVNHLGYGLQHLEERERHEREKLEMRLEIDRLRAERALPPVRKKSQKKNLKPAANKEPDEE